MTGKCTVNIATPAVSSTKSQLCNKVYSIITNMLAHNREVTYPCQDTERTSGRRRTMRENEQSPF